MDKGFPWFTVPLFRPTETCRCNCHFGLVRSFHTPNFVPISELVLEIKGFYLRIFLFFFFNPPASKQK